MRGAKLAGLFVMICLAGCNSVASPTTSTSFHYSPAFNPSGTSNITVVSPTPAIAPIPGHGLTLTGSTSALLDKTYPIYSCGPTRNNGYIAAIAGGNSEPYYFDAVVTTYNGPGEYSSSNQKSPVRMDFFANGQMLTSNNGAGYRLIINADGSSGAVDANLSGPALNQSAHVSGNWSCPAGIHDCTMGPAYGAPTPPPSTCPIQTVVTDQYVTAATSQVQWDLTFNHAPPTGEVFSVQTSDPANPSLVLCGTSELPCQTSTPSHTWINGNSAELPTTRAFEFSLIETPPQGTPIVLGTTYDPMIEQVIFQYGFS